MDPFKIFIGGIAPINRVNVDTDQIIPKQFLKRVERTGFGKFHFKWLDYFSGIIDFSDNNKDYK